MPAASQPSTVNGRKPKPRNVYRGAPLRREPQAMVAKAAEFTPEQIEQLKADFLADLNDWANRRQIGSSRRAKPSA